MRSLVFKHLCWILVEDNKDGNGGRWRWWWWQRRWWEEKTSFIYFLLIGNVVAAASTVVIFFAIVPYYRFAVLFTWIYLGFYSSGMGGRMKEEHRTNCAVVHLANCYSFIYPHTFLNWINGSEKRIKNQCSAFMYSYKVLSFAHTMHARTHTNCRGDCWVDFPFQSIASETNNASHCLRFAASQRVRDIVSMRMCVCLWNE